MKAFTLSMRDRQLSHQLNLMQLCDFAHFFKSSFRQFTEYKTCVTTSDFLIAEYWYLEIQYCINMGAFLDKPKTEKHNAHGAGNGLRYGLSSMQGWRVEMEDAHTAVVGIPHGLEDWSFFAVYDGHAGSRVANYCSTHLLEHITNNEDFRAAEKPGSALEPSVENVKSGIRTGFLKIDECMRNFSDLRNGMDRSGSTAVGVMISPEHVYFINCGDSRAVLYRNGQVCFSTQDHKPCNPREKERIQNAGGSVMIQRVNGSLAVSRALGDYDYKCVDGKGPTEQLVSPEPEVCEILRAEEDDQFIILACDGIWDVMGNEELCEFVKSRLEVSDDLEKVCNWVVDTCLHKGSRDNMSIVLVCLSNAPKVSDEAVKKDAELDKHLESRVEEIMEKSGEEGMPDLAHVIRILSAENIPNLPPGGGLAGKRNIIEAVYSRLNPHRENEGDPGEAEESGTQGKLVEALRQMRINHRGNYRHLLEEMLTSYRLAKMQGEECTAESAAASASDNDAGPSDPVPHSPSESGSRLAETQSSSEDSGMNEMSNKQT
ncbi:protein phosphatase 1B isoform X1 [Coturnix japonica]|uniref:protein phosphatase 1B isoform X1 n=2 Tax=Coturnix japonica TaxID=93934 RepID=UPI000777CD05|nr:protein phosphatase 1B isoform X1 [Coturnix japonica]